jgi:hypothetical protein
MTSPTNGGAMSDETTQVAPEEQGGFTPDPDLDDDLEPVPEETASQEGEKSAEAGQEAAATEPAEQAVQQEQQAAAEGQTAPAQSLDEVLSRTVEWKGKQWTVKELLAAGEYDKVLETARQLPALQRTHAETKKRLEELAQQQQAAAQQVVQQAPPPGPEAYVGVSDQWKMARKVVQEQLLPHAVKAGSISETLAETEPELAADLLLMRFKAAQVEQKLAMYDQFFQQVGQYVQSDMFAERFNQLVEKVAQEEGIPGLTEQDVRSGLLQYVLTRIDPRTDVINEDWLREIIWAYFRAKAPDQLRNLLQAMQQRQQQPQANAKAALASAAAGTSARRSSSGGRNELEEFERDFFA